MTGGGGCRSTGIMAGHGQGCGGVAGAGVTRLGRCRGPGLAGGGQSPVFGAAAAARQHGQLARAGQRPLLVLVGEGEAGEVV